MFEILLCSYLGSDHTISFEIIYTRIDDCQFVRYYFYVRSQILQHITCTKVFSNLQIISKFPAVKICACLSELSGTEFEGSIVQINIAWSVMCEAR